MNRESNKLLLLGITVFAASLTAGLAGAAGLDRLAQLGLAPSTSGAVKGSAKNGTDSRQPGLKRPRTVTGHGGVTLDFVSRDEGGAVVYGGTRTMPRLDPAKPQVIGGVLYPLSGDWFSTIETSVDAASPLPVRGYGLLGQVHRALPGGWGVSLGLHYNTYESSAARLQGSALEPLALPAHASALHPAAASTFTTTGYELRLNYRYGERNTLGVTYGSGSDLDYTRQMLGMYPGDGRQFGLTGEHWLTPDWALNYGVMAQEQMGPHRGQGLRLGLRYRF